MHAANSQDVSIVVPDINKNTQAVNFPKLVSSLERAVEISLAYLFLIRTVWYDLALLLGTRTFF